jgi:hypothetical protein
VQAFLRRVMPNMTREWQVGAASFRPLQERGRNLSAHASNEPLHVDAGPYRASGDWWTAEGWCRDYWDVHASDGAVYRLHEDKRGGGWFLDGYYD